ncbi:hypothetical protein J6590_062706 [Homalodisca vitripennis]|nr:hypothetical protein J6590_062706 [Homalodisca vitripennis]
MRHAAKRTSAVMRWTRLGAEWNYFRIIMEEIWLYFYRFNPIPNNLKSHIPQRRWCGLDAVPTFITISHQSF